MNLDTMKYSSRTLAWCILVGSLIFVVVAFINAYTSLRIRHFTIGDVAPDFSIVTSHGRVFSLSGDTSSTKVLFFFTPSCAACVKELQELNEIWKSGNISLILGILTENETALSTAIPVEFPLSFADEKLLRDYGINRVPTIFVLEAKRKLLYVREGKYKGTLKRELEKFVDD